MTITSTSAKRYVITFITLTALANLIHQAQSATRPDVPKLLIGSFLTVFALTLLAEPVPELAAALAFLIFVATLIEIGPDVARASTQRIKPKPKWD